MKRIFTLLCALMLLLTSFSGMVVSAAELDSADDQQIVLEEQAQEAQIPEGVEMKTPQLFAKPEIPATFAASSEEQLAEEFRNYLKEQFAQCKTEISLAGFGLPYEEEVADALMYVIWYEMPELFHCYALGVGGVGDSMTSLHVSYRSYADTPQEYHACLSEMQQAAEYLLRDLKDNDKLTDVEKALVLHDRLAIWTEYDMEYAYDRKGAIFSAYGALAEHSAVCQGYTLAYTYLLEQVGIQSDFCSSAKLNHAWNIVYIDGKPYYTDVTWDDPVFETYEDTYQDVFGKVEHDNFLRSLNGIKGAGHYADDFPQLDAGTEYDSGHFWLDNLHTSVELVENNLYYMTTTRDNNVVWKVTDSDPVAVFTTDWFYEGKLSSTSKMLLVSRKKDILMVNPANGQYDVVEMPFVWWDDSYISGMKFQKNKIWMEIEFGAEAAQREAFDFVDVGDGITITQQPKNTMVPSGSTAKVTVKAEGYGLTYRWAEEVPGIEGFTETNNATDTYTLKMTAALDGTRVYCTIRDMFGNIVVTDKVTLRMGNPAKITTQPGNAAAPTGSTVKVSVKATGDGITYAWYYRKKDMQDYKLSGNMKSDYLSVKMSNAWDGCEVYCVVTDQYGQAVTSNVVKLIAGNPPKFTTQPKTTYAANGAKAKVTVKASGEGLQYAWYYMKKGAKEYKLSGNMKSNYLSVTMSSSWNGCKVYCVITDENGVSVKSSEATLKMGKPAAITDVYVNNVAASGKLTTIRIYASGDGITYNWYYAKKGSTKFTKDKETTAHYTVKMSSSVDGRKVYCIVKDKYGNQVKSQVYTLYKGTPAKIKTQPKSTTAFSGKTAKVTVKASGSGLKYAWYYMKKDAKEYKLSGNMKTNTLSVKMSSSWDGAKVYCVVTDKFGITVKSSTVTLSLAQKAAIKTQPKSTKAYNGDTVKLSVKAVGDGVTYQWYYAKKGSSSFKKISGATKATYSVKMASSVNGRKYYCQVKDQYGNKVKSATATLTMHSFDPISAITGTWKSYAAYVPGYGTYELKGSTIKITSDKKATLKIKGSDSTSTFKFTWSFEELEGDEAYYYMESKAEDVYLIYSRSEKELAVVTMGGEVILFKK